MSEKRVNILDCCICGKTFDVPTPEEDHFYDWAWCDIAGMLAYFPCPECKAKYCQECIDAIDEMSDCQHCPYKEGERPPKPYVSSYQCCGCESLTILKWEKKHKIALECKECGEITTHFRIDTKEVVTDE